MASSVLEEGEEMKRIVVEIDCGETSCDGCRFLMKATWGGYICKLFGWTLNQEYESVARCNQCVGSEIEEGPI